MMTIENYISQEELKETMRVAREFRLKYGIKDYVLFQKLAIIAALQGGWGGYIDYFRFLAEAKRILYMEEKPENIYGFKYRNEIYGILAKEVLNNSPQELFSIFYCKRKKHTL